MHMEFKVAIRNGFRKYSKVRCSLIHVCQMKLKPIHRVCKIRYELPHIGGALSGSLPSLPNLTNTYCRITNIVWRN